LTRTGDNNELVLKMFIPARASV